MKQKFGIKKTKMNIFWLLVAGAIIGVVVGLRQQAPSAATQVTPPASTVTQGATK